jgi:hypothetical protein
VRILRCAQPSRRPALAACLLPDSGTLVVTVALTVLWSAIHGRLPKLVAGHLHANRAAGVALARDHQAPMS